MKMKDLLANKDAMTELDKVAGDAMQRMVEWQTERLIEVTRAEVANIVAQLVCSGDFVHLLCVNDRGQSSRKVDYVPFREKERLETENVRLREVLKSSDVALSAAFYLGYADAGHFRDRASEIEKEGWIAKRDAALAPKVDAAG